MTPVDEYSEQINRTLRAARKHLGVEVAFISEFVDGHRVFRYVDDATGTSAVAVDGSDPLEESYCHYVVRGEIPEFLRDPREHPLASSMATEEIPVGTHLSVPIRFSDGRTYGTFCCFDREVRPEIEPHTIAALRMMADLVAEYLEILESRTRSETLRREAIVRVLGDEDALQIAVQPIVDIATKQTVAVEALARFRDGNGGPAWFFSEAREVGLTAELELKAAQCALKLLDRIPRDVRLNVNLSPETLTGPSFKELIAGIEPGRLVVEVTEHAIVTDYDRLNAANSHLTDLGIGSSIDDVGAGFSGLSRILQTSAEELKIDRGIVMNIHGDAAKQAMVEALVSFCDRTNLRLVAEGVEREEELRTLQSLGIELVQGYYFARPAHVGTIFPDASASGR